MVLKGLVSLSSLYSFLSTIVKSLGLTFFSSVENWQLAFQTVLQCDTGAQLHFSNLIFLVINFAYTTKRAVSTAQTGE